MEGTFDYVASLLDHKKSQSTLASYYRVGEFFWHRNHGGEFTQPANSQWASARWDPSVWDLTEYIQTNCREKSAADGVVRSWSDLDRTGALAAHLAALDQTLDS